MRRPVLITTPIPTLDEVVKDLGIGKARRDSIIRIMNAAKVTKRKKISTPASSSASYRKKAKSRTVLAKNGTTKIG